MLIYSKGNKASEVSIQKAKVKLKIKLPLRYSDTKKNFS